MRQKEKLLDLLTNLWDNCGDIRGRDGNYLSTEINNIVKFIREIKIVEKEEE